MSEDTASATLIRVVCMYFMYYVNVNLDLIYMLSAVSNAPPASAFKTSSDLIISGWNFLMEPDILVQPCRDRAVMDSRKTKGTAITDFRVDSISRSEAVLDSAETSKASNNVGRQAALTAIGSSDRLDTEQGKYGTRDKISRPTRLPKSKAINSVPLPYEDQMYNAGFNVKGDLARHTKTHDTEGSFKCDICGHEFTNAGNLKRHTKIHTNERPFQCKACKQKFIRPDSLERHELTHTGKRPFQCDVCKQKFTQKHNLIKHKRIHTGERPFKCDVCQCAFSRADHLLTHKRTHTGERPFLCAICNKTFTQKSHLLAHMGSHLDPHRFKCGMCDAGFFQKSAFENHMHTHDENRHFKCDQCDKTFRTNKTLWSHKFTHSNECPFECDICNARFKRNSILARHKKIHTKEQPHKANRKSSKISSNRFTNNRNPDQLEPDHNNKKSFKSSHCDASFTSAISTQHIKPKTHTTHSETELTNPNNVSTTSQLPSMSNQPSTSDTHVNKSQNQKEYAEYVETVALLNEFADAYSITLKPGYCEHDDNLSFDQEIPEETFPDRQNTGAGCSITQWHPVVGWPSTNGIHINKSQDQKKYEEYAEYVKTVELLNEFADTYPVTLNPGSCKHHDNLFLDQEMP